MTARICLDCPQEISAQSKGRCRLCAAKANHRQPGYRTKLIAGIRRRMADPALRQQARVTFVRNAQAWRQSQDGAQRLRDQFADCRERSRTPEARANWRESFFSDIPAEHRAWYHEQLSRRRMTAPQARAAIVEKVAQERRARLFIYRDDAAYHLQRFTRVARIDPLGERWQYGQAEITVDQLIERALSKGWVPISERVAA